MSIVTAVFGFMIKLSLEDLLKQNFGILSGEEKICMHFMELEKCQL